MTIITKPSNEKNPKILLRLPIFTGRQKQGATYQRNLLESQQSNNSNDDVESVAFNRPHVTCIKTILLFLLALSVMLAGILGGYTLYRMYVPAHRRIHYRALLDVPYEPIGNNTAARVYPQSDGLDFNWFLPRLLRDDLDNFMSDATDHNDFFREEIEMDMSDNGNYAKVEVPDFKDGRHGRFMHDFKKNQSAIIDSIANRCFIMALDRQTTLPPKSLLDLIEKMSSRYYDIDTERIRHTMRVIIPPLTDLSTISKRIANECYDMKIYKLENIVSGISKRSAGNNAHNLYAQFLGKGIVEFDITNLAELDDYELNQNLMK